MPLAKWLAAGGYRLLDLKRVGSAVQAYVARQATHWLSPRWKTVPTGVTVSDEELAVWSLSSHLSA